MTNWMIPTYNDPLGAVREILLSVWKNAHLERLLLPQNGSAETTGPQVIADPALIQSFNPFTPLMPLNAAQLIPGLLAEGLLVGAVLRPCEMRTLQTIQERQGLDVTHLLTISVDCLGTLPADEYAWRAQRKGSPKGLTQEALHFAPQGGIVPYRYRAACQICPSPEATEADLNIGVLGLPVRQYLLIKTKQEKFEQLLQGLECLPIDQSLFEQHQRVTARLAERGQSTRQRIYQGLAGLLPANIDALVEPLQNCDDCQLCLSACPICTSEYPKRDAFGNYVREDVVEWLVSCSGCGMCEQACPKHLPLTIIFGHIRDQLAEIG